MDRLNGIVEDLGSVIGYSATAALVDWFGGGNLYVPLVVEEQHPIAKVIGLPAFSRLVREWPGETLWLPLGYQREQDRRDRMIAVMLAMGLGSKQVAAIAGMSERHVQHTRLRLEELGVMPMILRKAGLETRGVELGVKAPGKAGGANAGSKVAGKTGVAIPVANPGVKTRGKKGKRPW